MSAWVREHAPSLRQGGAGQLARMVMEAKGGQPGPARRMAQTPTAQPASSGLAVQAVAPDLGARGRSRGWRRRAGRHTADESTCVFDQPTNSLTAGKRTGRPVRDARAGAAVAARGRADGDPRAGRPVSAARAVTCGSCGRACSLSTARRALDDLQKRLARGAFLSPTSSPATSPSTAGPDPEQAATLEAAVGPLSGPAPNGETGEPDRRSAGQRRAEALIEICARAVAATTRARRGTHRCVCRGARDDDARRPATVHGGRGTAPGSPPRSSRAGSWLPIRTSAPVMSWAREPRARCCHRRSSGGWPARPTSSCTSWAPRASTSTRAVRPACSTGPSVAS